MRFAASYTKSGLIIYMDEEAKGYLGDGVTAMVQNGDTVFLTKGGGLNISKESNNNNPLHYRVNTGIRHLSKFSYFGKTEFNADHLLGLRAVIMLKEPLDKYKAPKGRSYNGVDLKTPAPTDAEITQAIQLLNDLDRDQYRAYIDTESNRISIKMERTFG